MTAVVEITPEAAAVAVADGLPESGTEITVPLNKLKKSPKNARKTPHSPAHIEALAASIAANGMIQKPVVEPELDAEGQPTGAYFVTVGEGRRLALLLRAKRKEIKKNAPVRVMLDTMNDPHEISTAENVIREDMHPADEFEAFREQAERRGLGPEEIAARFGTTAHVVRQRLKLANVSPKLLQVYRDGGMTLDQLMAFAITDDHEKQEAVWANLQSAYNREPSIIRRYLTEQHVKATDRRAMFVGADAYVEAGGAIVRDLFSEDNGGWFTDPVLLARLVVEKLERIAAEVKDAEGWKWAEVQAEFSYPYGLRRIYQRTVELPEQDQARRDAIEAELEALSAEWSDADDVPDAVQEQAEALNAELAEIEARTYAYDPEESARAGVIVALGLDGQPRIERGLVRPEDEPAPEPEPEAGGAEAEATAEDGEASTFTVGGAGPESEAEEEPETDAPLSDKLLTELTAARTLALREAVASDPHVAMIAVTHALALRPFYGVPTYDPDTCLEIEAKSAPVFHYAPALAGTPGAAYLEETHKAWAQRLPEDPRDLWTAIAEMDADSRSALFAYVASRTVNAVRNGYGLRARALAHADKLAQAVDLDMSGDWTPTVENYLGRVRKPRIVEAVREGVGEDAAERIAGWKKDAMAAEAETLLAGKGWLPAPLRTPKREATEEPEVIADDDQAFADGEAPHALAAE